VILRQFMVYIVVGVLTAILDIGTMQLLLLAGVAYPLAVSVGFGVGLLFNYLMQQRVTFKAAHSFKSLWRYALLLLLNYLLTLGCVELGVRMLDSILLGKLLSLPLVAVNGFVLGRYWVYRTP
jgi:putative flippase GtrA